MIGETTPEHADCLAAIAELRHELLRATDRAVGAEAELDRLRAVVQQAAVETERARTREASAERDKLREQIAMMQASTTWRIGRLIVAPAARLRRRGRR